MRVRLWAAASLAVGLSLASAQSAAALIDRGGGLIYDDVLNITWLQDANLGAGSPFDDGVSSTDGRMTWSSAVAWAASLNYAGLSGWRLPKVTPANGVAFVYGDRPEGPSNSYSGLTDLGFNVAGPQSELGYMFYVNLGNTGYYDTSGNVYPNWASFSRGPFQNLQQYFYWFGTEYEYSVTNFPLNPTYCAPPAECAWDFVIGYGDQTIYSKTSQFFAWAVHDGDVARVPEPTSLVLTTLSLAALGFTRRRRQQSVA